MTDKGSNAAGEAARWLAELELEAPRMLSRERPQALQRITASYDHYLAALVHYIDLGDMAPASRMVRGLRVYWEGTGRADEGRPWVARALARPEARARTPARAMLLDHAACLALDVGDYDAACADFRECLDIRREVGPAALVPVTLAHLGIGLRSRGDLPGARAAFEECIRVCEETGDEINRFIALFRLACVAVEEGNLDETSALLDRSDALRRLHPERAPWGAGSATLVRAIVAAKRGRPDEAKRLFDEGVALMHEGGLDFTSLPPKEQAWYEAPIRRATDGPSTHRSA
jgi:non-specific serine/threonine protein kinase